MDEVVTRWKISRIFDLYLGLNIFIVGLNIFNMFRGKSSGLKRMVLTLVSFMLVRRVEVREMQLYLLRMRIVGLKGLLSQVFGWFNFSFLMRFWLLFKEYLWWCLICFTIYLSFSRCFASYFLTLIPKVNSPTKLGDFRPISLMRFLYKMVVDLLRLGTPLSPRIN